MRIAMVTAGAAPSRGAGRARWLCLALAAALAAVCLFLFFLTGETNCFLD